MEWILDGIGTELIGLAIGALLGGGIGYKIGIATKVKQKQIAGDGAKQQQNYNGGVIYNEEHSAKIKTKVVQSQKAGSNAIQVQTGGTNDKKS